MKDATDLAIEKLFKEPSRKEKTLKKLRRQIANIKIHCETIENALTKKQITKALATLDALKNENQKYNYYLKRLKEAPGKILRCNL